jgi:HEAT repeat protein
MAQTQDTTFREFGVRTLGSFYAPVTLPILVEHLRSTNVQMAVQAATVLGTLGSRARDAGPSLLQCLNSSSEDVRTAAAFALNSVEPQDVPSLLYLLEHAPLAKRLGFCWMIGRRPEEAPKAVPVLIRCLNDPQPQICEAAAETLGKYGTQAVTAVPPLQKLLDHPKKYVRVSATNALQQIQAQTNAPSSSPP